MVALLSQCFNDEKITKSERFKEDNLTINKPENFNNIENSKTYPFPPQKQYVDLPKPQNSDLLKKDNSIINTQLSDLTEYVEYLEKLVVDYRKSEEDRANEINAQKYQVVEGFSMGKNTNDLIIYIMTCIFVLLLIDYIFKMGKSSY